MRLIFLFAMTAINFNQVYSQNQPLDSLNALLQSFDSYRDKEVTMVLRLKNVDYVMEKIAFYDKDNIDITFDIDRYEKNRKISESMRDIHEGSRYYVTFTVREKDQNNMISGAVSEFRMYFVDKLP